MKTTNANLHELETFLLVLLLLSSALLILAAKGNIFGIGHRLNSKSWINLFRFFQILEKCVNIGWKPFFRYHLPQLQSVHDIVLTSMWQICKIVFSFVFIDNVQLSWPGVSILGVWLIVLLCCGAPYKIWRSIDLGFCAVKIRQSATIFTRWSIQKSKYE